jgi:hypothetical protein
MPHRPDEEGLEPEGGGAGERLRQHLDSRYPAGEWPPAAPIEDVRDADAARRDDQASIERQPPLSEEFTDELGEEFSDQPEQPPEANELPLDSGENEDIR